MTDDDSYHLLPYPLADSLPPGQGGLAIHSRPRDGIKRTIHRIDGKPAMTEFGDAVLALPPGPHIVEVPYGNPFAVPSSRSRRVEVTTFSHTSADVLGPPLAC